MQNFAAGQSNRIRYDVTNRSTGAPVTAGTVNAYLQAMSGTNEGKWFRASDSSWQSSAAIAGSCTHDDDGHWYCAIATAAWTTGARYNTYAKESGDLHISVSEEIAEGASAGTVNLTIEAEVDS